MNSLSNLSRKNLKINRNKNILIIIAIVLSTCLITTISILTNSIRKMEIDTIVTQTGDAHVKYKNITDKQLKILKNNKKLSDVNEYIDLGVSYNYSPYVVDFFYVDKEAGKGSKYLKLKKGNFPKKDNEIAMPKWMVKEIGGKPIVGEKINLVYSHKEDGGLKEQKKSFILSGILDEGEYFRNEQYMSVAVVSKSYAQKYLKNEKAKRFATAKVKGRNIKENAYSIAHNIGLNHNDVNINTMYIKALGLDIKALIPAIIGGFVVILATVLVIYNIFYISIKGRIKQFGMLASLGATKKQIRKLIFKEGLFLSLIGIPLGIILGYLLSYGIVPLAPVEGNLKVESSYYTILISVLVSLLTVIMSLRKPSRIASKISPIEAIKYNTVQVNTKKKQRKSKDNMNLRRIAYFNLWRSKKRTITTIMSMALTGVLFIMFFSVFTGIKNRPDSYISSDFELSLGSLNPGSSDSYKDHLNKNLLNHIESLKGVRNIDTLKYNSVVFKNRKKRKNNSKHEHAMSVSSQFFGFDDSMLDDLKPYVLKGEILKERLKNKNEIIMIYRHGSKEECPYSIGDKVKLSFFIPKGNDKYKEVEREFTIGAIVSHNTRSIGFASSGGIEFISDESKFENIGDNRVKKAYIDVDENNYNNLNNKLKNITTKNKSLKLFNKKEYKKKESLEIKGMEFMGVSLILIIGLIGTLNSINTMATNVMSRKKEFAMMEALGLTKVQIRKLLKIEGIYYSVISIIISSILGTILSYFFSSEFGYNKYYQIPFGAMIIVSIAFIIIQLIITYVGEGMLKKDSIVDKIRYSE